MTPRVVLKPARARPFFGRHPWVFAGAIQALTGDPADGDEVELISTAGNVIARGLYNSRSKIRVRLYTWKPDQPLDESFFREKLAAAIQLRRDILRLSRPGHACRIVFSESDGLSGMVVEQYDQWLVVQFTGLGLARRQDIIIRLLNELLQPRGIYLRTERGIGQLEGLDLRDGILSGTIPDEPIVIEESGVLFQVHLAEGQKTGFFLDQRNNRVAVARLCAGRKVLDAFCYTGGFGLHAARQGATSVIGVDVSEPALTLARANAERNRLTQITFEKSDVFNRLDSLVDAGEKFGVVILDPPKFARQGAAVGEALRGYRRLLSQALRLLEADGVLVMCCCTGLITADMLHDLLAQVSVQADRSLQILETRGAAPDHPVAATCLETNYLKCIICRVA